MDFKTHNNGKKLTFIKSGYKRFLFMLGGHLALIMGIIGILLPIMPTVPFILLAAFCYARSSEKFYYMLLNNKYMGHYITDWEKHRCINKRLKQLIFFMLIVMFSGTIYLFIPTFEMKIIVATIAIIAIVIVAFIPVCQQIDSKSVKK